METGAGFLLMVLFCGDPIMWFGAAEKQEIPAFVLRHEAFEAGTEPGAGYVTYLSSHPMTLRRAVETVPEDKQFLCDQQT